MPTSAPVATSFLTDSGVNATRASPCCCSRGTAILICPFPLSAQNSVCYTENGQETLLLKAHIYKSMALNARSYAECDEGSQRGFLGRVSAQAKALGRDSVVIGGRT